MTDETPNPEIERKKALIAEGAARNPPLKMDMRWSVKRMEDALAGGEAVAAPQPQAVEPAADPEAELAALKARMAAQTRELEEARAELAAKPADAAIPNMTTSMSLSLPGDLARQEAERKMLMDRCMQVGIAHLIPARANCDSIRDILGRHMAEKAQKAAAEEAAARIKAKGPAEQFVKMRVLPLGDKRISRGIHVPGFGDEMYERGDIIENVPLATAKTHEANGMGEILIGA